MILQHLESKQSNFVKLFRNESKQSKMIPKYLIYDGFWQINVANLGVHSPNYFEAINVCLSYHDSENNLLEHLADGIS
jgi:hypothetical protein